MYKFIPEFFKFVYQQFFMFFVFVFFFFSLSLCRIYFLLFFRLFVCAFHSRSTTELGTRFTHKARVKCKHTRRKEEKEEENEENEEAGNKLRRLEELLH